MLRPKMGSQTDKLSQNALFPHKISLANQSTPQPDLIRRKSTHFAEAFETGLRYATVLGAGGTTFGLGFFESVSQFESLFEHRDITIKATVRRSDGQTVNRQTVKPSNRQTLKPSKNACPVAICWEPKLKQRRPGPDVLAFLEGLMQTLAQTTEDEMDSGRWKKKRQHLKGRNVVHPIPAGPLEALRRRISKKDRNATRYA